MGCKQQKDLTFKNKVVYLY